MTRYEIAGEMNDGFPTAQVFGEDGALLAQFRSERADEWAAEFVAAREAEEEEDA